MSAFPHVSDPEITEDTIESTLVKSLRVMNRHIDLVR